MRADLEIFGAGKGNPASAPENVDRFPDK